MTCLPPHINNVPARILLHIIVYLDDDTLLAFLTACCRILSSVSSDEIDWEKLYYRDSTLTLETHYWQTWHYNVLEKESTTVKHKYADIQSNYEWLRSYVARLNVTNNWRKKAITSDTFYITDNLPDGVTSKLNTRIIANNVYGTLILTDVYTLYLVEHDPKPKLLFIANVLAHFSADSYARITGALSQSFIVLAGPKRVEWDEPCSDAVVYWEREESATMNAKLLPDTDGATQIVQIVREWLILKKPTISSETYPIIVFNLSSPEPLRIESASNWNTYLIRYFTHEECIIYAARFGFSSKNNKLFYNWSLLKATLAGMRHVRKDKNVTLPSLARRYGACHSRLLLFGEMVLVWQYASASNEPALSMNDNKHAVNGSSSAQLLNTNQQTKDIQNLFFIHCMNDSSICYEGTFTEHLPEIATNPNRIIILNGTNLKIVSLESKHTIVDMMIAPNLTYAGFALDRFWVTQHPTGGFYVMDAHNPDKTYHIPCDDVARNKTVAINPHMLMKVIGNKVILWNIKQTV